MTEGCPERLTGEFLRFVWEYPKVRRPVILEKLRGLEGKQIIHLQRVQEVELFLARLPKRIST